MKTPKIKYQFSFSNFCNFDFRKFIITIIRGGGEGRGVWEGQEGDAGEAEGRGRESGGRGEGRGGGGREVPSPPLLHLPLLLSIPPLSPLLLSPLPSLPLPPSPPSPLHPFFENEILIIKFQNWLKSENENCFFVFSVLNF